MNPLETLACTIDASGISAPTMNEILQSLIASSRIIFGADTYLEPDSQDYELLATFAQAMHDGNQTAIGVYNGFSPSRAVGAQLSSLVKINGIRRNIASRSTVPVTLLGTVGSIISNGMVSDGTNDWTLPATVVIPIAGEITVTGTATKDGAITAKAGSVTKIKTPTLGWQSVTNPAEASPGTEIETDAKLRRRQALSTSISAQTPIEAITAKVANVAGVGRYQVYENDTNVNDLNGIPGHSIAVVVEGGDANEVAKAIQSKKNPGTGTHGTTGIIVNDSRGIPSTIRFFNLREVSMSVLCDLAPLTGYVSTTADLIRNAIAAFFTEFPIGQDSYLSKLLGVANLYGSAAVDSSGKRQFQLDEISTTYSLPIQNIFQGRSDMVITGRTASTMTLANVSGIANGIRVAVQLADGSYHKAIVQGSSGLTVTIAPNFPTSTAAAIGGQVLVNADVPIAFNEGTQCAADSIRITP